MSGPDFEVTAEMFEALVQNHVPMSRLLSYKVDRMEDGEAEVTLFYDDLLLRPGGMISGPAMMMLADTSMYAAVVSKVGLSTAMATATMNFSFMRSAPKANLKCKARLIKHGKRMSFGEIFIYTEGDPAPVCHATSSYVVLG